MDHRTVAAISVSGILLDVLGGLYLAYDLLGGQHGPLRLLTRAVTYSVVFGIGYGIGLGAFFGIASGIATGVTMAIELNRTARRHDHYPLRWEAVFSAIRAAAFGAGLYQTHGLVFSVSFAILITLGQIVAYTRGIRPGMDYVASRSYRITARQLQGVVERTVGYILAALTSSFLARELDHPWIFALRVGVVTGLVTAVGTIVNPRIEYYADHLPERRLGVYGIWLVLSGFALQSFQYWVTIFDLPVS